MAIREPLMSKTVMGAADLTLRADVGESLLIKGIYALATIATYATLRIEKTTVGFFRVDNTVGNHLSFPRQNDASAVVTPYLPRNLLDLLYNVGIFTGYPIGEGETFTLTGLTNAADIKSVLYEIHDAGDKKPEDMNGSRSKEYFFVNYGDTGAVIDTAGDQRYDNPLNPVEFPAFPYLGDVPAKTTITLHGVCGKEAGVRNATPVTAIFTQYLKFVREREVLFDKDRLGLIFNYSMPLGTSVTRLGGGQSVIGNYDHIDTRMPYFFTTPLEFTSGEELNVFVTTVEPVDGSNIAAVNQVIGLIETVRRD